MSDSTQSMFFKSEGVDAHWDTWMFFHEGTYYLFYLITEYSPGEGFGLATSPDGVTWTDHGWAIRASDKMVTYLGTGAVWKSPDFDSSGRFICNYSEWRVEEDGRQTQNILFAWSDDLMNWTKFGDDYMFKVDTRWYEQHGRWDCIFPLPRPQGGYYGYWTATPNDAVGFGFGQSEDGVHWEALPSPELIWEGALPPKSMEAGAVVEFSGKYYAIVGQGTRSMKTMIADSPGGPYCVAPGNYGLLENSGEHKHTYFARFLPTPDATLVNHHAVTRFQLESGRDICYLAPLKRAFVDDDGTLWFGYWQGNERLKKNSLPSQFTGAAGERVQLADTIVDAEGGVFVEGQIALPVAELPETDWPGLYIEYEAGQGSYIQVGASAVTHFGLMAADGDRSEREDVMARAWPFGPSVRFRMLLKASVLEFYLDDLLVQSYSLPAAATGRIGLLNPANGIADVQVWNAA